MAKIQPSKIRWTDIKTKKAYLELKNSNPQLFKQINHALDDIEQNSFCAVHLPKRLIPKTWKRFSNLWKYDLPKGWRLFYSIAPPNEGGSVEVIAIILDWMSHKEYENLFKY